MLAHCTHLDAHFLDEQLLRTARRPVKEIGAIAGPMTRSFLHPGGAPLRERVAGLTRILALIRKSHRDHVAAPLDPLARTRRRLESEPDRLSTLETEVERQIEAAVTAALAPAQVDNLHKGYPERI